MHEGLQKVEKLHPDKWVMEISQNSIGVTHPDTYDFEKLPVETISMSDLVGFEPDEKMESVESSAKVLDMVEAIHDDNYNEPPILVREYQGAYQVVDGHHRFHAHLAAGSQTIEVRVVPDEDVVYIDSR